MLHARFMLRLSVKVVIGRPLLALPEEAPAPSPKDQAGWTPLMWAALECRAEIVKLLVDRGAAVSLRAKTDEQNSFLYHGQTAILIASGCFIAHRRADLAPERHMALEYAAYELAAAAKWFTN